MNHDLARLLDPQQPRNKAGIEKIELGRFDQPLVEIPVMGLQQKDNVACFEHGEPGFRCIMGDSAIVGQRGKIKQLPGSGRTHAQEQVKAFQIPNLNQLVEIPFHIGADVTGVPVGRGNLPVIEGGVGTGINRLLKLGRGQSRVNEFAVAEWQQLHHADTPRQGLGDF